MASSDPPSAGDRDVFSGLPNARPQRRSAKRDRSEKAPQARAAVSSKPAAAKPAKPRKKATPKPKAPPVPPAPPEPVTTATFPSSGFGMTRRISRSKG